MNDFFSKIIKYSLYLLVFLLPLQTRWIINAGESEFWTYSLYITDVLLMMLLVFFILLKIRMLKSQHQIKSQLQIFNYKLLFYSIFLLNFACFISVFFAIDKYLALYKFGWLLLAQGIFWMITSADYNRIILIWSLLTGIFLQASLGIFQFLTQSSFASKWLGIALHDPWELGVSVIETVGVNGIGERWLRAYGGMDHPNVLGGLLAIGLLTLFYFIKIKSSNIQINYKFKIQNIYLYTLFLVICLGLIFTFSRGAWIAFGVGTIFLLIVYAVKKEFKSQREILMFILFSGILFFIFFNLFNNLFITRIASQGRLEEKSQSERLLYLKEAKDMIFENYLTGVGIGSYSKELHNMNPDGVVYEYQPVHNVFLLVWAETGVLGFLGLLGFLGFSGWNLFKKKKFEELAILFSLIILMIFDHWLWSLHFGILFFFLVMGILLIDGDNESS